MADLLKPARALSLLAVCILPALLIIYNRLWQLPALARWAWITLSTAVIAAAIAFLVLITVRNYQSPPQWDFQLYWVFGRAAVTGQNPYDVERLRTIARSVPVSDELLQETFYLHSPPTLFLFAPLGWFDIHTACLIWQACHLALLALAIGCLWRIFFPNGELIDLLLVAVATMLLRSTLEVAIFTQVNFLALLLFLGTWQRRSAFVGGILLGLALIVKPVFLLVPILLVARGYFWAAFGLVAVAIVSCVASIALFGWEMFSDYFVANPLSQSVPHYFYTEWINQSLLATCLRITGHNLELHGPYDNVLFLISAGALSTISAWTIWRLPARRDDFAMAIVLVLSMLLFPKTLSHYGVLLLPPILLLCSQRDELPWPAWTTALLLGGVYLLTRINHLFLAMVAIWLILVFASEWPIKKHSDCV